MLQKSDGGSIYDMLVIGLGPAGLGALCYAGFLGLSALGIDELDFPGGKIPLLYGWKPIPDLLGRDPAPTGNDFVDELVSNAKRYGAVLKTKEKALNLKKNPKGYFLLTAERNEYATKTLIIACGLGSVQLNYFSQKEFMFYVGKGLSYYKVRPQECAGKHILVVGGGASAVEMAPYIAEYAEQVVLIHRRDKFRDEALTFVPQLNRPNITVLMNHELKELNGQYRVESVTLRNVVTQKEITIRTDNVIACLGYRENLKDILRWFPKEGLRGKTIKVNGCHETVIPGIFAIAECITPIQDVCQKPCCKDKHQKLIHRIPLIQTWLSEAMHATSHAYSYLNPGARPFQGYGTLQQKIEINKKQG